MSLVNVQIMIRKEGEEMWERQNVKFNPQSFIDAPNKSKFMKNLASQGVLGSVIAEIDFKYSLEQADKDLKQGKKVNNEPKKKKK